MAADKEAVGAANEEGPAAGSDAAGSGKKDDDKKGSKRWYRGRYSGSRRHKENGAKVDRSKTYEPREAFQLLKGLSKVKFDETVEISVRLGIDPKKTDQLVRGAVGLPHGLGKTVRIAVFAEGDKAKAAEEAGAEAVGSADLAKRVEGGWLDFDVAIASPDMMKYVGRLGRILGPQGKMPSPKAGTVTPDVATAVKEFKAGKIEFRTDSGANVHAPIGKCSFDADMLVENAEAFVGHIRALKPPQAKGAFVVKVTASSTMGPGIRVALDDGGSNA